jgi:hypothetical protein
MPFTPAGITQEQLDAAERLHKAASLALQVKLSGDMSQVCYVTCYIEL